MPKYYVDSGSLRFVGEAESELMAAQLAISQAKHKLTLSRIIRINEQGFDKLHSGDVYIDTMTLLQLLRH